MDLSRVTREKSSVIMPHVREMAKGMLNPDVAFFISWEDLTQVVAILERLAALKDERAADLPSMLANNDPVLRDIMIAPVILAYIQSALER